MLPICYQTAELYFVQLGVAFGEGKLFDEI